MRPVSSLILTLLLLAICGLCAVQWWRETELRKIAEKQRDDIARFEANELEQLARLKAADAEILRLTASLADLRNNSISKDEFDELKKTAQSHVESINKQNEIITQQNESITKQNEVMEQMNASVLKANETIKTLAEQRDQVVQKFNDLTQKYNQLANPNGSSSSASRSGAN